MSELWWWKDLKLIQQKKPVYVSWWVCVALIRMWLEILHIIFCVMWQTTDKTIKFYANSLQFFYETISLSQKFLQSPESPWVLFIRKITFIFLFLLMHTNREDTKKLLHTLLHQEVVFTRISLIFSSFYSRFLSASSESIKYFFLPSNLAFNEFYIS